MIFPLVCLIHILTAEYKPILEEVERMLSEAGLDEEEIRRSATSGPDVGGSRNRR